MAKVKISGDSFIIQSALKFSEIETLAKFRPGALKIMEAPQEDQPVECTFKIELGTKGSASQYGITFPKTVPDKNAEACITLEFPREPLTETVEEWIYQNYGSVLQKLNSLEHAIAETSILSKVASERDTIINNIESV